MKNGILTVSFGTTYHEARKMSLDKIETDISSAYSTFSFYKAYTSKIVRERILAEEGLFIPDVALALQKMYEDGIGNIYIQPTHIIPGSEFNKIPGTVDKYRNKFKTIHTGVPLLSSGKDYEITADILDREYNFSNPGKDNGIILMGHGSGHAANECYGKLQETLIKKGFSNVFVSTVEGTPDFKSSLNIIKKYPFKNITLIPFMTTAGDHVNNDMAGAGSSSWENILKNLGYNVCSIKRGLGELPEIRALYLSHLKNIIDSI